MKILVTGGTGRIGANLVTRLLAKGHEIRSLVYPGDSSRAHKLDAFAAVETVTGDLRNLEDVRRAVQGVDAIYHLAAAFGGPFDNRQYLDINAMGTLNLLESVRAACPNLHRFVYACTEAIYWRQEEKGRYFEEPITEEMVARYLEMPYFLTKRIGEELAMAYHYQYGVPTTSFRFSTVIEPSEFLNDDGLPQRLLFSTEYNRYKSSTGADPDTRTLLESLRSQWTGEEQLLLSRNPNGVPYRQHFCDVRDIARGLALAIEKEEAVGEEFTLGGRRDHRLGRSRTLAGRTLRGRLRRCPPAVGELFHARSDKDQDPVGLCAPARSPQRRGDRRSHSPRRGNGCHSHGCAL